MDFDSSPDILPEGNLAALEASMSGRATLNATAFIKMLRRIICRTEKDLQHAEKVIERITLKRVVHLNLYYRDGNGHQWTMEGVEDNVNPWRDFQTWFHGRPQSETYCIHHREGSDGILRSEIKRYAIRKDLVHG